MRILFAANTPRDPNLGAAGCDLATIAAQRDQGHQVDEIWGTDMPKRITHNNLHQLLELPRNFANAVANRCAKESYDVIQVNQPHAWLAAKQHRLQRRPGVFINRSHGWEPCSRHALSKFHGDVRPFWRRGMSRVMAHWIEKHNQYAVDWSDGLVLCSKNDRDFIIERHGGSADRLLALAPGIPRDFLVPRPDEPPGRWTRLLFVGNFAPYKAPDIAAEVFREVIRAIPDCRATWVCPARFHDQARQLIGPVAAGSVTFLDWMPRDQLRALYDGHGLMVIPSYFEGFSLTFLEAMARGMCVLGTMVGGLPQVIRHDTNGYLFRPGAADGITERALQLVAQPDHCRKISAAASKTALEFTWERAAREYVAFCQRLIQLKGGPVTIPR
jgi:glycosyltransferase involved in cell wall biosynthesis